MLFYIFPLFFYHISCISFHTIVFCRWIYRKREPFTVNTIFKDKSILYSQMLNFIKSPTKLGAFIPYKPSQTGLEFLWKANFICFLQCALIFFLYFLGRARQDKFSSFLPECSGSPKTTKCFVFQCFCN